MRATTVFFLWAVVFCTLGDDGSSESISDSSAESDEEDKEIKLDCEQFKQQTCPRNGGDPICGTNNKNYPSECALCLENQRTKKDVGILKLGEC
ncbi:trypsin inhibitor ClTI-1-like [Sphaerodactylus townsendi]|uniref:trypsin inhibitor ClTI-1-like n=1 Tax=Sphaerodactylus townsendi TaxID=933632 RepID=UPI00202689A3|nr:trypsin inhibitor ClTI-1-like [Sphaerodactylus townsendi]XP_048347281.1 trypsin inhibitor ClTI-1-like [Sphaerodactylus townsendi]XP_048347282.1 trypsin inhibitor ClTI-1-like [Sphaerodactylus townsendi]